MAASTKKHVEELEGRKLDAAVAEEVMGWKRDRRWGWAVVFRALGGMFSMPATGPRWTDAPAIETPPFSTDIEAAWEVVGKLVGDGIAAEVTYGWRWAERERTDEWASSFSDADEEYRAFAGTAPLAICRAALKAVRARAG